MMMMKEDIEYYNSRLLEFHTFGKTYVGWDDDGGILMYSYDTYEFADSVELIFKTNDGDVCEFWGCMGEYHIVEGLF